jgi:hypothetical protein
MALLVCFSCSAPNDHMKRKAIYLDQAFYGLIFRHCREKRSHYSNLSVIAALRYEGPLLVVHDDQLAALALELDELARSGHLHPQLVAFRNVCREAEAEGCSLSISGDMYPEL